MAPNLIQFSYKTYRSELLEPPYTTDCRYYRKSNLESNGHCLDECYNRIMVEKFGYLPMWILLTKDTKFIDYRIGSWEKLMDPNGFFKGTDGSKIRITKLISF